MSNIKSLIKSTYQLNSIVFDILSEFAADNDNIDEGTYMPNMREFINRYCINEIEEAEVEDIFAETYIDSNEYFDKLLGSCADDYTSHQKLRIVLITMLLGEVDKSSVELIWETKTIPTELV